MSLSISIKNARNTPDTPIKNISRGGNNLFTQRIKKSWLILFKTKIDHGLLRQYQNENREKLAKYSFPLL